jgi:DNA-binding transcriptional regulator YhcF (GntR family)/DNA-binding LacI/PurR family transcriptional regulator
MGCRDTLPSVRKLARDAGVSLATMNKAIRALRSDGRIETTHGKGMRIVQNGNSAGARVPNNEEPAIKLWRSIQRDLERDIITGVFNRSSMLPSLKELKIRFGANYRTLKKAIDDLRSQRIIEQHGRGYRVSQRVQSGGQHEILVFLYRTKPTLSLSYLDPHLLHHIESICQQAGLKVTFIRYVRVEGVASYTNHTTGEPWTGKRSDEVLGCMWIVLFPEEIVPDCCHKLMGLRKPVSVFAGGGARGFPEFFVNDRNVKFFMGADTERTARVLGSYLTRLGHRHFAFFTCSFHRQWARARLQGIEEILEQATSDGTITPFTVDYPGKNYSLPRTAQEMARTAISFSSKCVGPPGSVLYNRISTILARAAEDNLSHGYYLWTVACELEPLFAQALAYREITAWVFGDDEEAIIGLDFLKRHRILVPGRISVAGFNDSQAALAEDLTSCGSNFEGLMTAMLNYVLQPGAGPFRNKKEIALDGFVMARKTVAARMAVD